MRRYRYSLVRCVPEPSTGEFINVGAIAGSADDGDWSTRQISNFHRALRLCTSAQLGLVMEFMADVSKRIDDADETLLPLSANWLDELLADHRNVVQLSPPQVAVGASVDEVLDLIVARQLIDPAARTRRPSISKNTLVTWIRRFMSDAIDDALITERPLLKVGQRVTTTVDFVFGREQAAALTQAWSFQRETIDDLAKDVKAWGYAVARLRGEKSATLEGPKGTVAVDSSVPIDVLYAPPITSQQQDVFGEAMEVFASVNANLYTNDQYDKFVADVSELVALG